MKIKYMSKKIETTNHKIIKELLESDNGEKG